MNDERAGRTLPARSASVLVAQRDVLRAIEKAGEIRRPFVLLCTTSKHYLRFLAAFFAPPRFLLADLRPDFFVADFFFLVAMIHSPL